MTDALLRFLPSLLVAIPGIACSVVLAAALRRKEQEIGRLRGTIRALHEQERRR